MKDTFSFRDFTEYLSDEQKTFVEGFASENVRGRVILMFNMGMTLKDFEKINLNPDTDGSKIVTIHSMITLLSFDGKRRIAHTLHDYGVDCNLPLRTLEAMSHALTTYRWDADMVKKLAYLDENQIDVVMTGYMICHVHGADKFFKEEVMDPKLTVDEMIDKVASVSNKHKK